METLNCTDAAENCPSCGAEVPPMDDHRCGLRLRRNPLAALPAAELLMSFPQEQRDSLAGLLMELAEQANDKAETAWRRRKGPMAAYWRAVSTYAKHTARLMR